MVMQREGDKTIDRRVHERVAKLEDEWRIHYAEHTQLVAMLTNSVKNVETLGTQVVESMREIAEVVKIYNNTRGFVTTMRVIGSTLLWVTVIGGALAAMGAAIKYWVLA